jgi:hypothetical protein
MREYDPSVRAEMYHMKTKTMPSDQIQHMDAVSGEIEGMWTDAFMIRLFELRDKDGVESEGYFITVDDESQEND